MDYSVLLGIEQIRVNNYHDIQNASPRLTLSSGDSSKGSSGLNV